MKVIKMKVTTIILGQSQQSQSPEEIMAALVAFMPVIAKVDTLMCEYIERFDRILWYIEHLGSPYKPARAEVRWMSYENDNSLIDIQSVIEGKHIAKSGFVVKSVQTIQLEPNGDLVVFAVTSREKTSRDADVIAIAICEEFKKHTNKK